MRPVRNRSAALAIPLCGVCFAVSTLGLAGVAVAQPTGATTRPDPARAKEARHTPGQKNAGGRVEVHVVKPSGEYAQIDTTLALKTVGVLKDGSPEEKLKVFAQIRKQPEKYAPPVLYLLSNVLFQMGDKDEAAFWFYAGQVRARFDANRCAEPSARAAVSVLNNQYGPIINRYTFGEKPAMLDDLLPRVVDWDRKTAHDYDHRWINLHGMGAVMSSMSSKGGASPLTALSLPKEQWEQIAERTRSDYLISFRKAKEMMKTPEYRKAEERLKSLEAQGKAKEMMKTPRMRGQEAAHPTLESGVDLFHRGEYREAYAVFRKLLQSQADDARIWYFAALSYGLASGEWDRMTQTMAEEGVAREKANKPPKSEIDAALAGLTKETGKDWLDFYRRRAR
jgi:tetratricopeptide (TPR) repeat protein